MIDVDCHCTRARRLARALTEIYDAALAPAGLKVTQFGLMRMVGRLGRPTITALAEATGLDRSTLGRNLKVMEKDGLVELGPGRDERTRQVGLTRLGAVRMAKAAPLWEAAQAEVARRLPTDTLTAMGEAPAALVGAAG